MKSFTHILRGPLGLHARPAGALAALSKEFESTISIRTDTGPVEVHRLMAVMRLCLKQGDSVTLTVDGPDEEAACAAVQDFFSTL